VEALKQGFKIRLFASDIEAGDRHRTQRGLFAGIEADVSPQRLARFLPVSRAQYVPDPKLY